MFVCHQRLQEYLSEFKAFRELKDSEVAREREELSSYRRNLESQLRYFIPVSAGNTISSLSFHALQFVISSDSCNLAGRSNFCRFCKILLYYLQLFQIRLVHFRRFLSGVKHALKHNFHPRLTLV